MMSNLMETGDQLIAPSTKKANAHYVDNKKFYEALVNYRQQVNEAVSKGIDKPQISNYLGDCFIKIATHLSYKANFINYTFKDDMISDGIENCLTYFENFDTTKSSNAFAYFTQIIYYAFLRRIRKEKKQLYVKYKATEQFGILDEHELLGYEEATGKQFEMYDNISEFIETFEETKKKKKEEKASKKGIENFLE